MDESNEENFKHLPKQLLDRHVEIQRQMDKRREERLEPGSLQTQIGCFLETFNMKTDEINGMFEKLRTGSVKNDSLPDCFDKIMKDIQMLNRYLSTSSSFLCMFNIRKCKLTLDELSAKCKTLEDELLPKKKFGFKSKLNKTVVSKQNGNDNIEKKNVIIGDDVDSVKCSKWKQKIEMNDCGFSHRTGEYLKLDSSEINGKDLQLSNLSDCTIVLMGAPNTLHASYIDKCRIFCGPVTTSVFIDNCNNCTLVFPCQQLRIHHTHKTNFYIHVTSRAIIEDSDQIQVAPFNWSYASIEDHFTLSGLDPKRNNWNSVDDFNWLAQDQPSPNWSIIDELDRTADWNLVELKN